MKKEFEEDVRLYGGMQSRYSKKDSGECNGLKAVQGGFYVYSSSYSGRALYFEAETLRAGHREALPLQGSLSHWKVGKVFVRKQSGFVVYAQHCGQV